MPARAPGPTRSCGPGRWRRPPSPRTPRSGTGSPRWASRRRAEAPTPRDLFEARVRAHRAAVRAGRVAEAVERLLAVYEDGDAAGLAPFAARGHAGLGQVEHPRGVGQEPVVGEGEPAAAQIALHGGCAQQGDE